MSETNANWGSVPPPPGNNFGHDEYAGFWIRLFAHVCDQINALIIVLPVGALLRASGASDVVALTVGSLSGAWLLAHWTSRRGGSPLRVRTGVLVLDATDGSFLDANSSLKRAMFPAVLSIGANLLWVIAIPLLLDYLTAIRHPRRQTWHDKYAGSVVVKR